MFFDKKVKRSMEVMNERNRQYLKEMNPECPEEKNEPADLPETVDEAEITAEHEKEYRRLNDETGFEKGDIPALIISALIVFSPIFLVLIGIIVLAWIFLS